VLSAKAVSFIDSSVAAAKPFMLQVAPFTPHRPNVAAPRDADEFPGLTAPRTPAYDKQPSDAPTWLTQIPPLTTADAEAIDREHRRRAQSVLAIDDMIGRIQQELAAKGVARNTYLVFSSDNGYHLGEHQLRAGKQTAFDTDIHVPLIVTGPGVPADRSVAHLASSIEHHGPTRTPNDPDQAGRMSGNPPSYEAVRTATALYVRYGNGEREYYDTGTDPFQLHNLAATVSAGRLAPLQRALSAMAECHNAAACQAAARVR